MLSTISRIGLLLIPIVIAACGGASDESAAPQPQQPAIAPQQPAAAPDTSTATGSGRITGFVFEDKNRNGTFDATDARMPQQAVVLTDPSATRQVQAATTDADGSFRLENLAAGEYRISVQIPEGYERTNDDSFEIAVSPGVTPPDVQFGVARQ